MAHDETSYFQGMPYELWQHYSRRPFSMRVQGSIGRFEPEHMRCPYPVGRYNFTEGVWPAFPPPPPAGASSRDSAAAPPATPPPSLSRIQVAVAIDAFPELNHRKTADELGNAWEKVVFVPSAQVGHYRAGNVGSCHYVDSLAVTFPLAVEYYIAKGLWDDAHFLGPPPNAEEKQRKWERILNRVRNHAREHYERVRTAVIPPWRREAEQSLDAALPTRSTPTSTSSHGIQQAIDEWCRFLARQLGARIAEDVYNWEMEDYPDIDRFIARVRGGRLPRGQTIVPRPGDPVPFRQGPPQTFFPPCRPTTGGSNDGQ
jgi:hypothetical protein